jgi:hypothetical protein
MTFKTLRGFATLCALTLTVCALAVPALAQIPAGTQPPARVGPARYGDGEQQPQRLGNAGEQIVGELNGKYYEAARRGMSFIYSTAQAGVLLAAPTTTFFGPMLWNPCGSGHDLELTKVVVADVSGTTVRGHLAYAYLTNTGSQAATGSPILTNTLVTPVNGYIGSGLGSSMRWSPAVGTYTTAPTYLAPMGPNVVATAPGQTVMVDDVDGRIVLPQCTAFFVGANAGVTLTAAVTIYGIEVPTALTAQ